MGATKVLLLLGEVSCTVVPLRRTGKVRLLSVSVGGPGVLVSELPVTLGSTVSVCSLENGENIPNLNVVMRHIGNSTEVSPYLWFQSAVV